MTDDTIRSGKQAREDTFTAMLESGALRGFHHRPIASAADLDVFYEEMRKLPAKTLYVYRVSREMVAHGRLAGATSAMVISDMPENVRGWVMFAFDGWADDPRELFQVPEVIEFCRGLLFGLDPNAPNVRLAQGVTPYLVDEWALAHTAGSAAFDLTGRLWVVGTANPEQVYRRSRQSASGWSRDVGVAAHILNVILRS